MNPVTFIDAVCGHCGLRSVIHHDCKCVFAGKDEWINVRGHIVGWIGTESMHEDGALSDVAVVWDQERKLLWLRWIGNDTTLTNDVWEPLERTGDSALDYFETGSYVVFITNQEEQERYAGA